MFLPLTGHGCSATAAAMMFSYFDNMGYPDIYTGPTNDGVMPMTNDEAWGSGNAVSATHLGIDGRTTRGHVDDYWIAPEALPMTLITNGWTEHARGSALVTSWGPISTIMAILMVQPLFIYILMVVL